MPDMFKRLCFALFAALLPLSVGSAAFAHGGHDPRVKVWVSTAEIRLETSLSVNKLPLDDVNKDGKISKAEYLGAISDIMDWTRDRIQLTGPYGSSIDLVFEDAPIVSGDLLQDEDPVTHFKILKRFKLDDTEGQNRQGPFRLLIDLPEDPHARLVVLRPNPEQAEQGPELWICYVGKCHPS